MKIWNYIYTNRFSKNILNQFKLFKNRQNAVQYFVPKLNYSLVFLFKLMRY